MPTMFNSLALTSAKNTAWIFGAGASVPYNVPPQPKLLERFAKMPTPGGVKFKVKLADLRKRVEEYCRNTVPGLSMVSPELALEEVFAAYELTAEDPRVPSQEREQARKAIWDLRDCLKSFLRPGVES